jgi:hypothetical protein
VSVEMDTGRIVATSDSAVEPAVAFRAVEGGGR